MGPAGPAGPGTRVAVTATVNSSGVAVAALPASVGTSLSDPPGLTCYVNQPGTNSQLLIGTDLDGPACGLTVSGATLNAVMIDAPPGWNARFVAVR
jgi:ABC-type nitrate/sulfonate/bicarbonate transport system substrate-binding protein